MRPLAPATLVLSAALAIGCTNNDEPSSPMTMTTQLPGPAEWNRDVTPPSDGDAQTKRAACGYKAGDLPAETQGDSHPNGKDIPIDHLLVLMMENRSFDHYFQKLPEYGQPDVDVAPPDYTNLDPDGNPVKPFHDEQYCFVDTNHEWSGTHHQINGGKMDGFYLSNEGHHELPAHGSLDMLSGKRALGYYDETDLPFYYWLANEFSIANRYFCSVPGPTWPNRMFLYAATSFGLTSNTFPNADKTLPSYLEERKIDWKIYASATPGFAVFLNQYLDYKEAHVRTIDDYYADAAAGTLPQFAFLDPGLGVADYDHNDEHPPAIAQVGQAFTAGIIDALMKSPNWARSALFLTYDEHGGLYDHVPPPSACKPDDLPVKTGPDDVKAEFDMLGVRVPMMVISPFAKKHHVSQRTYDHTSIVRFIEAKFTLPALTNRDANAEAPWDMFDFENPPHATPPTITIPTVNAAKLEACGKIFEL